MLIRQLLHRSKPRAAVLLALALAQAACGAGWRQPAEPLTAALRNPRQQVQVWQAGRARQLHGVVVSADSVSGIPFLEPLECESCRIVLARAEVDSLRVGNPTGGFWRSAGLTVGILFGLAIVACARARTCNYTE